ncbi:MAG: hypothetical protein PHC77_00675 [Candidatus Marinimicrobia bacterium]|jgi:hypothetical protein|nr:hypothetical protein [Candidatus Neomarinimicrobiota bacterium]MDX9777961.1 hypothetical protein [bacterium]
MKINLLREDQMEKVPHPDEDKNMLQFDDTFSGGNDDFYFQQPAPASEEYKRPKRSRIWLFIILLLIFLIGGAFISNPRGTRDFFVNIGSNVVMLWDKAVDKIASWLHRGREADIMGPVELPEKKAEVPVISKAEPSPKPAPEAKIPDPVKTAAPVRQTVTVEKKVIKEVIKESLEEKVLESPLIYDRIRDELALSKRNSKAAEYIWSNLARGMIIDRLDIGEDRMNIAIMSRNPMLLQTYAGLIGQKAIFASLLSGETEIVGEFNRIQMTAELPSWEKTDRPERIWDLDVEWFDDYLNLAAQNSDVNTEMDLLDSRTLEESILQHEISLSISGGSSASMSVFLQELNAVPAAFVIRNISSVYDGKEENNYMDLSLVYYERK